MRIGILSYPLNNNYGCYLQAYALLHTLEKMGHDVVYINRRHDKPDVKYRINYFINTIKLIVLHGKIRNPFYRFEWIYMKKKGNRMLPFFENNIPHTNAFYSSKSLERYCQDFDAIIVGSDQVWRAGLIHSIEDYYLSFLKNSQTLRISYAASFGNKDAGYTKKQIGICGKLIESFNSVSVREPFGLELIQQFGWKVQNPKLVLDPTMLLGKSDYQALCPKAILKSRKIFCYILDKTIEKQNIVDTISHIVNEDVVDFLHGVENDDFVYPSVQDWLASFMTSNLVITDSFHGTVFSILFHVPFVVFANVQRGADRVHSLLATFDLGGRLYDKKVDLHDLLSNDIDWNMVDKIMSQQRQSSMKFLTDALKYEKTTNE